MSREKLQVCGSCVSASDDKRMLNVSHFLKRGLRQNLYAIFLSLTSSKALNTCILSVKGSAFRNKSLFSYRRARIIDPRESGLIAEQSTIVGRADLGLRHGGIGEGEKCFRKIDGVGNGGFR